MVVIIYDIVDNKKRYRFAKFLKSYGVRVQKSAFECILSNKKYDKMIGSIEKYIGKEDLLRVYKIASNADVQVWGDVDKTIDEEVIII